MLKFQLMGSIICIASLKGGVGKTTTAVNLSSALAVAEKSTLLVDCDPQGNATTGIGIDKAKISKNLYHGMVGNAAVEELITKTHLEYLKTIPARLELINAQMELISRPDKEKALRNLLRDVREKYDFIIIDSPPSLGILTLNAIAAADSLLIPLQCEFYALEGLGQLLYTLKLIRKRFNPGLKLAGIVLTMFRTGEDISQKIAEEVRNRFNSFVFKTMIPRDVQLRESPSFGKPLLLQDVMSLGARSYFELAHEIINLSK